ncbi:MAG: hypothetical protein KDK11_21445 [Maritimibacter sp.]|nr:hypothetical protein [Maritimibacter sp.]
MPISYSIMSDRDLALVVYEGEINAAERSQVISEVVRHRNFRPDQMHLIDLSGVTGWEPALESAVMPGEVRRDWMRQARETLCVYYAPTEPGQALAAILVRAWDGIPGVVPLVLDDEAEALAILGQTEMRVAELPRAA